MDENIGLQRCIKILKKGGLLVAPSDTVYGLVCDSTNEVAVKKLISIKNRPLGKPISVFVADRKMIDEYAKVGSHGDLLKTLLPGPFTIVLPSKKKTSRLLESERGTLGIRLPKYDFITRLVSAFGKPLTATSANISGRPPHYEIRGFLEELSEEKRKQIDSVVDCGKLPHNKPSTIIDLSGNSIALLRKGDIIPQTANQFVSTSPDETRKIAAYLLEKYDTPTSKRPLIFILTGEMGAGKTVFAKGIGARLGVDDIISPTYVVYYEYPIRYKTRKTFLHADLYNLQEQEEFAHLGLENYINKETIMCVEWGEKVGPLFDLMKKRAHVVLVEMTYREEKKRDITIKTL